MDTRLDAQRTDAYLARLGLTRGEIRPDIAALTLLHERHLRAVPFENLSVHLRESIVLEADAVVDKLTVRGRGGFCYEPRARAGRDARLAFPRRTRRFVAVVARTTPVRSPPAPCDASTWSRSLIEPPAGADS